jgi:caffeoyl-CoA O-methyltransferase
MSNRTIQVDERLYDYILKHTPEEAELLRQLRDETARLGDVKRMQISPEQGQLMALLAELTGARTLLEVGTFTGYSALACALVMPSDAQIVACDISEEWTSIAQRYWQKAGVAQKMNLKLGPASQTLQDLIAKGNANTFDMMFIDADKGGYDTYYELGLQLIRPGGLIMIDNVLWSGAVANPSVQDADTVAIRRLNKKLASDPRVTLSMLPVGDGLTLARRRI